MLKWKIDVASSIYNQRDKHWFFHFSQQAFLLAKHNLFLEKHGMALLDPAMDFAVCTTDKFI